MTDKRIAVVTGANRGIGKEIARQLGKQPGIHVVLTARDSAKGQEACDELTADGCDVSFRLLDVGNPDSIRSFVADLEQSPGHIDILVNNAGIYLDRQKPALEISPDIIRQTMEINLFGPFQLCQAVIPLMKKQGYGRIVNMSSGMGSLKGMLGTSAGYRLSKTALNASTRIFAAETEGTGVLVNCMCPGWVKTDMGGEGATRSVEEGADTAVWLATLDEDGPTGQLFRNRHTLSW